MPVKNHSHSIVKLLETMQTLRSPEGCPWDAEQTPQSLTPYILEEACELIDAIETGTDDLIREELGDLLLQVIFQAQIFAERNSFDFNDVADTINAKLLRRHPHVFDRNNADQNLSNHQLDQQWETIKQAEKESSNRQSCLSDHLPSRLPALQRAQKLVNRLHKSDLTDNLADVFRERFPLTDEPSLSSEADLGLRLMHLVIRAENAGFDAERALRKIIQKTIENLPAEGR